MTPDIIRSNWRLLHLAQRRVPASRKKIGRHLLAIFRILHHLGHLEPHLLPVSRAVVEYRSRSFPGYRQCYLGCDGGSHQTR